MCTLNLISSKGCIAFSYFIFGFFVCAKEKNSQFSDVNDAEVLINFGEVSSQFAKCSIYHVVTFLVCQYVILQYQF